MKTLLIMRHAKSDWGETGLPDHDRPLNHRGERDAPRMGRFLASMGLRPGAVLSSTALRACTTANRVIEAAQWDVPVEVIGELYLASPQEMLSQLETLPNNVDCALLVAHNPGVAELASVLSGNPVTMPTAAVAEIHLAIDDWLELDLGPVHPLKHHWYPKGLPSDFA